MLHLLAGIAWDPQIRGFLAVLVGVVVLLGSVYLLLGTNLGARLGFLVALTGLFGWCTIMGLTWWVYGTIGMLGEAPSWEVKEVVYTSGSTDDSGLAVASLTGRRAFAIGGYLLLLIAPTVVAGLVGEALGDPDWPYLFQLSVLPINFAASLFPDTQEIPNPTAAWAAAYLVVVGLAALVLLRRYRRGAEA